MQLLTTEGLLLAEAALADTAGGAILLDVTRPGRLLAFYFGEQHRHVILRDEGVETCGRLPTRWLDSTRQWLVEREAGPAAQQDRSANRPRLTLVVGSTPAPASIDGLPNLHTRTDPRSPRAATG